MVLQNVRRSGMYSYFYGTVHYKHDKELLTSFDESRA